MAILKPSPALADQRGFGQDHIAQPQMRQRMRRDHLDPARPPQPGTSAGIRKADSPRAPGASPVRARSHRHRQSRRWRYRSSRRQTPAARPPAAVALVAATSDPDPGSVSAKPKSPCPPASLSSHSRCSSCAEQADRPHPQPLHGKGKIRQARHGAPASRGSGTGCAHPAARPRRAGMAQPAACPQRRHQPLAGRIHIAMIHRQWSPHQSSSAAAKSRWRGSKNGQSRKLGRSFHLVPNIRGGPGARSPRPAVSSP
jgi:hypothetical protein